MSESTQRKISIHCHPFEWEKNNHIVEKSGNDGIKHYYLRGISSGMKLDGTGERMTENCIQSMHDQGKNGNVLLYEGQHGVNYIDDLGILSNSDITPQGEWLTEYRVYDESDSNIADDRKQKAKQLIAQTLGLAPYKRPIQKGFSVEGVVPENEIKEKTINPDGSYSKRVINYIQLDGVLVVPRPAYQDSIVTAVYKCLGELPPQVMEKLQVVYKDIFTAIPFNDFYRGYFDIQDMLYDKIHDIMKIDDPRNKERLNILFGVHKDALTGLIFQNEKIFKSQPTKASGLTQNDKQAYEVKKALYKKLGELVCQYKTTFGGKPQYAKIKTK